MKYITEINLTCLLPFERKCGYWKNWNYTWGSHWTGVPGCCAKGWQTMVWFISVDQSCLTLCNPVDCSMPGLPVHHQLPEPTQLLSIALVMPSNHLILCHPLLLLPSIFPSIRVFSNESVLPNRWPKYLEFQHQSFQWIFRTDFL